MEKARRKKGEFILAQAHNKTNKMELSELYRTIDTAMKRSLYIVFIIILLSSCRGSQPGAAPSPYQRKPIAEVSAAELSADSALIDATAQMLLGNMDEAAARFGAILKKDPGYAAAHYQLGKIYLAMGWMDSALVHAQQAWRIDEENCWYEILLAKTHERRQDGKNLTATWEDIVKRHPEEMGYYYELSNAYLMTGRGAEAVEALDRLERRYGVTEDASIQKQKIWLAIDKPDKARKELMRLAEAMPSDNRYNAVLAESYMNEKDYAKALTYYNRILENDPNDESIHISLAACHLSMGDIARAYSHLRLGVRHEAVSCQDKLTFLTEFMRDKRFFAAYSRPCFLLADTLMSGCAEDGGQHFIYGQLLAAQERYGEAADQLEAHLGHDKGDYAVWEALLVCEERAGGMRERLLEHARQASELFPLHLRPYLIMAEAYLEAGDCEKASEYIGRCMMVAPSDNNVKELNQKIKQQCPTTAE